MKLTQEQKRIKIAGAQGWTGIRGNIGYPNAAAEAAEVYHVIPNYFNDLNACHEMEKRLTYDQYVRNTETLDLLIGGPAYRPATYATAAQRAEAFGLTLNLWTLEQ